MDAALHDKILALLDEHRILSLATLRPDGWPQATTVGYVNDGLAIYFMCAKDSQKARNLAGDDRVSLTIDHDTSDPMAIRGLSMAARAVPVTDEATFRRAMLELLPKKYPEYGPMMSQADMSTMMAFRIVPQVISVLDYTKGFGHSDLVQVFPEDGAA
jgi:nitroimidazol reductase NimA-like FMN-containing flavoprotein (pyridoxamine 5'-phosphate oxidase superfamily)